MRPLVLVFFVVCLVTVAPLMGQPAATLFYIERNRDSNQIRYDLNLDARGDLVQDEPIIAYWIKNAEQGQREPLTWIQQKLAYGLRFVNVEKRKAEFQFVSYKNAKLYLLKEDDGYEVYLQMDTIRITIQRIFVQIEGGSFLVPTIPYVNVFGKDPSTHSDKLLTIEP
jgi:hypothetical protein